MYNVSHIEIHENSFIHGIYLTPPTIPIVNQNTC